MKLNLTAFLFAAFTLLGLVPGEASAYNCRQSCRDQCWVTIAGIRNVNPACQAACQSWKHLNCHNINPGGALCGEIGANGYVAASNEMLGRSVGKPRRRLTFEERTILHSMYSREILTRTQLHFSVPPMDKIGGGRFLMSPGSTAQTYGYDIYFKASEREATRYNVSWIMLLAHELKHVEQFVNRGRSLKRFGRDYFEGWCNNGFAYSRIPMEKEAHGIEDRAEQLARNFYRSGGISSSDNRYALTCLKNTLNFDIKYQVKWGDGSWQSYTVEAGRWKSHYWRYAFANEDRSPKLYIRFDWDLRASGSQYKDYWLKKWAHENTNCEDLNKWEEFKYTNGRSNIDLFRNH